jgi:cytochrome c biogenesis protein CcmG/thiol:disulfide interchange protein DsbE
MLRDATRSWMFVLVTCAQPACATQWQGTPAAIVVPGMSGPDFAANRLDGSEFQLSSVRGRVVVLDIWAVWCKGCDKDLPLLDEMAIRLEDSEVSVIAVSIDSERAKLDPLAKSRAWELTMLHDPSGRVADLYQPTNMPAVYLIDRSGTVRHTYIGMRAKELGAIEGEARALSTMNKTPGP